MSLSSHCIFRRGRGPIVAAAIHNGHDADPEVEARLALSESERLHEEDPWTGEWTQAAKTQIVGLRSRFEVDLNRPREKAVYLTPDDAWGLHLWRKPPDKELIAHSLREYDEFYADVEKLLGELVSDFGHIVVFDLHTYNHRREGESAPPANPEENPEVNIGTGTMDRMYWRPIIERFIEDLHGYNFHGRPLDVRENVKFKGGHFGEWIHQTFPQQVCSLAIEFKKFFMNEWTGLVDPNEVEEIYKALCSTVPGVEQELKNL